jgi:hypothetical protein
MLQPPATKPVIDTGSFTNWLTLAEQLTPEITAT